MRDDCLSFIAQHCKSLESLSLSFCQHLSSTGLLGLSAGPARHGLRVSSIGEEASGIVIRLELSPLYVHAAPG
jgi:hypothetical protein